MKSIFTVLSPLALLCVAALAPTSASAGMEDALASMPAPTAVVSPDYLCKNESGNSTIAIRTKSPKVWADVDGNEGFEMTILDFTTFRSPHTFAFSLQTPGMGAGDKIELRLRQDFRTQVITATFAMGDQKDVFTCKFIPQNR